MQAHAIPSSHLTDDPAFSGPAVCAVWPPGRDFWADFALRTRDGKHPYLFKGLLPTDFPAATELDDVLRELTQLEPERRRFRIYLDAERRNDLAEKVLGQPFSPGQVFPQILERASAERVGFMINDLQDVNARFKASIGALLESMYAHRGFPHGGVEQILFAGNYAGTAFGAHRGFEHAFLIHLGPGIKEFHLWSQDEFEALTGALDDVADYQHLLPHAHTVRMEPGDVLYLPALWFHIGTQSEYSVSVAVGLYDYPAARWVGVTLQEVGATLMRMGDPEPYLPASDERNHFAPLAEALLRDLATKILKPKMDDYWFKRRSNGGFISKDESLLPARPLLPTDRVRVSAPHRFCWSEAPDGKMSIYLRYRRFQLKAVPGLEPVLAWLNERNEVSVAEIQQRLGQILSEAAVLGLFQTLVRSGGLVVSR